MTPKCADMDVAAILSKPACSIEETAQVCGIGRTAAYQAAMRGEIPTIRIGRRLLVPTAALRRMLQMEAEPQRAAS